MFRLTNALVPQIIGPGLNITVSAGNVFFNGFNQLVTIGPTQVSLSPSSNNYVYLNPSTKTVIVNQTGFPAATYPIALVVTSQTGIITITDKRADGMY